MERLSEDIKLESLSSESLSAGSLTSGFMPSGSLTLESLIQKNMQEHPDKEALIFQGSTLSWQDLEQLSRWLAEFFLAQGMGMGSRIAILGTNSLHCVLSFLAAGRIGVVPVLINPGLTDTELLDILEYSCPDGVCFLTEKKPFPRIYEQKDPQMRLWNRAQLQDSIEKHNDSMEENNDPMDGHSAWGEGGGSAFRNAVKPGPDDTLCMLFTSGTTSHPKGVLLRHHAVVQVAFETAHIMGWTKEDRFCLGLPLFHVFGLSAGLLAAAAAGASVCLLENGHSLQLMETVERCRCTVLNGVPTMFLAMLRNPNFGQYDLSSLKSGVLAGAGITPAKYMEICEKLDFGNLSISYGMTETSPSLTFSPAEDPPEKKAVSVGRPIPNIRISIRSEDGEQELPEGQSGEVCVKGFNVMKGYFQMGEATKAAFDPEGWFHTGDQGYLDQEGYLHISGRLKDIIIRSGEKLSPMEIENVLLEYPAVQEAKAVGVYNPVTQEEVAACLVKKPGMDLQLEELEDYLSHRLAAYKIPRYYLLFPKLPVNAAGKTDGKRLKAILMEQYQKGLLRQSVLQIIKDI